MQKTGHNRVNRANRRKTQASTTLNRKYTKRPAKQSDVEAEVKRNPKVQHFVSPMIESQETQEEIIAPAEIHPIQESVNVKMKARTSKTQSQGTQKISAKELKEQAIQKALATAANTDAEEGNRMPTNSKAKVKTKKVGGKMHFGFWRVMLALSCAAAAVFAIAYFVNLNMPDISMRVAAMQTGMEPTYPNYVPRDYSVSSITSESGKITMEFRNYSDDSSFTIIEEKSSWDTNALVSNYVKEEYGESYTIVREQGLTIYVSGSDAAWVNGGVVYKIKTTSGSLTNKQIRSIAVSM